VQGKLLGPAYGQEGMRHNYRGQVRGNGRPGQDSLDRVQNARRRFPGELGAAAHVDVLAVQPALAGRHLPPEGQQAFHVALFRGTGNDLTYYIGDVLTVLHPGGHVQLETLAQAVFGNDQSQQRGSLIAGQQSLAQAVDGPSGLAAQVDGEGQGLGLQGDQVTLQIGLILL
jgi:hypothetical protein